MSEDNTGEKKKGACLSESADGASIDPEKEVSSHQEMDLDEINSEQFSEDEGKGEKSSSKSKDDGDDSEGSGEDLMDNLEQDYEKMDELDKYERRDIDDELREQMPIAERQEVEKGLDQRDKEELKNTKR